MLGPNDFGVAPRTPPLNTWVGLVAGLDSPLPIQWQHWDCRNNRLAWRGLQADDFQQAVRQAVHQYGAHRIAVVMGSSTASIGATEDAYQQLETTGVFPTQPDNPDLHSLHSLAGFVQQALELRGPCQTISTACSSSAKAFACAERMLRLGLIDAAVVGGVDSLCGSVLYGFNALQLVSPQACRPFDPQRTGINIGEAAGFALLERGHEGLQLMGYGETSDAHHLSAPSPDGNGAEAALYDALSRSGLSVQDIGYIHLHGTATPINDSVEANLIVRMFPKGTPCSSSKGLIGHTLGAAGAMGAVFSLLALETGILPGTVNTLSAESQMEPYLLLNSKKAQIRHAVCNTFAFGGSNCVLVFGRSTPT